jgi:UDP-glucose 4-epimerase
MKILVTGGLGFVGINVVRVLAAKEGTSVVAADVHARPSPEAERFLAPVARHVHLTALDVTDRQAVQQVMQQEAISHVVHGAALTPTPQQEAAQATRIVDVNLGGAVNVLDAACASPTVQRILLLSSSGVYGPPSGDPAGEPQAEEGALALDNLYSITKRSMELLAARYGQLSGRPVASLRLASVYGPMEAPSQSRQRTTPIHQLRAALLARRPVRVAGPAVRRDWIYAADVAEAIWLMLNAAKYHHPVYNVGSGSAVPFREVVEAFVPHGLSCEWTADASSADIALRSDQSRAALDIQRLHAATGFVPAHDLASGVAAYLGQY